MVEEGPRCYRFACNTCPYVQNIERTVGTKIIISGATNMCLVSVVQVPHFEES